MELETEASLFPQATLSPLCLCDTYLEDKFDEVDIMGLPILLLYYISHYALLDCGCFISDADAHFLILALNAKGSI